MRILGLFLAAYVGTGLTIYALFSLLTLIVK